MRRTFSSSAVVLVTVVAISIFSWTLVHALFVAPDVEIPSPSLAAHAPAAHAMSDALPVRLIIPAINVDANLQRVGLKADGSMGTPNNFTDAAWYKYGTIPGQTGSAVIDGHVDNGLALPGVFKHLGDLQVGDDVYVEQQDGARLHFVVVEIESYPYKNAPTNMIFDRADAARLNLITCEGHWVKEDKTYDQRLVVFTKLVSS